MRKTTIAAVHIGTQACANQLRESHMNKSSFPSDTIALKAISTGGNSAGNGGDGYNSGKISNSPSINFNPYNKAEGADVHVNTGDKVYQKADWEAGGANAKAVSEQATTLPTTTPIAITALFRKNVPNVTPGMPVQPSA